jgi:hypothetical protein
LLSPPSPGAPSQLFITGMGRSGTTLLEKLVALHPEASVLSQPLPLLYIAVKREFLRRSGRLRGVARHYPFNDMLGDNYYPPHELVRFIEGFPLRRKFCRDVLVR